MKKFLVLLAAMLLVFGFVGSAGAIPVYNNSTYGSWGEGNNPGFASNNPMGYYIWGNSSNSWSIRWTGNDNGTVGGYDWYGQILILGGDLQTVAEVKFESSDSLSVTDDSGVDVVSYEGKAGPHYDGVDISLDFDSWVYLIFRLGSSSWNLKSTSSETEGQGIYIGNNVNTPKVVTSQWDDGKVTQDFEIDVTGSSPAPVPEPATMFLLGSGLIGLGGLGRKKFFKKG